MKTWEALCDQWYMGRISVRAFMRLAVRIGYGWAAREMVFEYGEPEEIKAIEVWQVS